MYWCESSTIKKAEHQRIDAFGLVLEKSPESPLDNREIQPVNPKVNHPWLFIGRTDAEAEVPILWPPDSKSQLTGKDPDAGKDWRQEKGPIEDKMVRWHHWLSGCEFKQAPGDSEGQGSLVSCSPWGWKESDVTEQLSNKGFQTPPVPMILTCWDPKTILVNRLLHSGLICRGASGFPFGGGHAHTTLSPQASVWRCSGQQFSDFLLRTVLSVGPCRLHPRSKLRRDNTWTTSHNPDCVTGHRTPARPFTAVIGTKKSRAGVCLLGTTLNFFLLCLKESRH